MHLGFASKLFAGGVLMCLVMLCLAYVMACEWCLDCVGWQAPCYGIELSLFNSLQYCDKSP